MTTTSRSNITISEPSTGLQQMCNYVAIAETKSPAEVLRELILHTLLTFEEEKPSNVQGVADILRTMFGVGAPTHQIRETLDQLESTGQIHSPTGTSYVLTSDTRLRINARINQATQLQVNVKNQWLAELEKQLPTLSADLYWSALQAYLAKAFLRHGIQVATFLDPAIDPPPGYAASLSTILADVLNSKFEKPQMETARHAISNFLASVGKNPERSRFIAECADGAANFFSLAVSPDVAKQFREKLNPITLFCDTNFLFGILDLHVHPLVEVSNRLLDVIDSHKLPLKMRYHAATLRELQTSISHYADILRKNSWSRALSRAATTSRSITGIEQKYHQKNSETGIDVDTFLQPYQHVDVLLKDHNIVIFRPSNDRLIERATLEAEYGQFLARFRKEKLHELIAHDVAVLDCVRSLRDNAKSTLDAGALFITCDYTLYRFDIETSRNANTQSSVVLPNVLWQILRPFIPAHQDFDRSFAETFAIPEFRTIGSGAAKAASKMLGLLALYKDFPEETAARLLSNDLLISNLRSAGNDIQFQAEVESAIALENQALIEERAAMEILIETLRGQNERAEHVIEEQKKEAAAEAIRAKEQIEAKRQESEKFAAVARAAEIRAEKASAQLAQTETAKASAEKIADGLEDARQKAEKKQRRYAILAALGASSLLIVLFEVLVYQLPWIWLRNHPNSFGLQGAMWFMILSFVVGLFRPDWRKVWGVTVFVAIIATLLTLLGGPTATGTTTPKGL